MPDEFLLIEPGDPAGVRAAVGSPAGGAPPPARPRVIGLAYAGGAIRLPGWRHPVVVDLAGLAIPESLPLLANHENRTASRVGMISARVVNGTLEIEGEIVASGGVTEEIVAQAKAGADWQLSIGAEVKASELVRAGETREVNGRHHDGPFFHIRRAALREVSVVAVGADGATRLKIAAHFNLTGGPDMAGDIDTNKPAPLANAAGDALGAPAATPPAAKPESKLDAAFAQWLADSGIAAAGMADAALAKLRLAFDVEKKPEPVAPPAAPTPEKVAAAAESEKPAPAAAPPTPTTIAASAAPIPAAPREPEGPRLDEIRAAAVKAERERVQAIRDLCGHRGKLADDAIRAGWDVDFTSRKLLAEVNSEKPQGNTLAGGYKPLPADLDQKFLEAALCRRADFGDEFIAAHFGDQVAERARRGSGIGLKHLFSIAAKVGGHHGDGEFDDNTLYAALNSTRVNAGFSSFSLPGILSNVANKMMMRTFEFHQPIAKTLCRETSVSDLKEKECFRLSEVGELEELAADGEIKHGAMAEERATIAARTWAKMYSIPRKWIINDDMGAFDGLFAGLGASAARNLDQVFFRRLMSNPEGMFSAAHGNYLEGADSALTIDGLKKARELFMLQTNIAGEPILVSPKYLLVPVALDMDASEILHSTTVIAVGAENRRRIPTDNPVARLGLAELSSPFLENPRYPGHSRSPGTCSPTRTSATPSRSSTSTAASARRCRRPRRTSTNSACRSGSSGTSASRRRTTAAW